MWLTSGEHHRPHCSQVRIYTRYDITLPLVAATSARDNSNWPLAGRLVAMPERTLKDMTYIEGFPSSVVVVCVVAPSRFWLTRPPMPSKPHGSSMPRSRATNVRTQPGRETTLATRMAMSAIVAGDSAAYHRSSESRRAHASQTRKSELGHRTTHRDSLAAYSIRRTSPEARIERADLRDIAAARAVV